MNAELSVQELHDRITRGLSLSPAEQVRLAAWYVEQDEAEQLLLKPAEKGNTIGVIQAQIRTVLTQLLTVTQRIQELNEQNESLRRETTMLKQQLAQRSTMQTA